MLLPSLDLPDVAGTLVPEDRTTRGVPGTLGTEPLGSRVMVGGPVALTLDPATVEDPAVAAALEAAAVHHYTAVRLAATFEPAPGETFVQAWVQVILKGQAGAEPPLAWSMTPDRVSTPRSVTTGVKVTADLKLVSIGASRESEVAGELVSVAAINLLRADPAWEFSRTETSEIRWCHDLALLVRSPAGAQVVADLAVVVSVRRRHLKVFPYRVLLDGRSVSSQFVVRE